MRAFHTKIAPIITLRLLAAFVGIICFTASSQAQAIEKIHPFMPGEKLTFEVKWCFIPAGTAILQILPMKWINGVQAYHFVMTTRTYPFVDLFYKVRDRIDAYADASMTHSLLYKNKKEGKSRKDVVVHFDWLKHTAHYSNFGEQSNPIRIKPGSFDPLSVFYALRLHRLSENSDIQAHVTDGKRCVTGKLKIIRRETVKVASGTYDTLLAEPELRHIRGVFKKSKNAKLQIWVSADRRQIPVKIRSKVSVGSFVAELISAENLSPAPIAGTK
ncbi:MAG: DUF3108 domain-containing protein [Thermodesulfobacteriota bacterium]